MYLAKYLLCYVKHSYRNISIPIGYRTIITCKSRIVRSSLATVYLIDCLLSRHFHLSIGYSTSYWLPAHQTFPSLHWIQYIWLIASSADISIFPLATEYLIDCRLIRHFHLSIGYSTSDWLPAHQTFPPLCWLQFIWLITSSSDISTSPLATVHLIDYQLIRHFIFPLATEYLIDCLLIRHFRLSVGYSSSDWLPAHQECPSFHWLQYIWLIACSSDISISPLVTIHLSPTHHTFQYLH